MKKIFLLLTIVMLWGFNVKADVAPPIEMEEQYVEVTLDGYKIKNNYSIVEAVNEIGNIPGVEDVYLYLVDGEYKVIFFVLQEDTIDAIKNVEIVKSAKYVDEVDIGKKECSCPDGKINGECLDDKDVKSLQTTTYILYVTEAILLIITIIVVILMVRQRKNKEKKD